ncbi:hypothetical protein ACWCOP_13395 [Maricaulaceae bacterium MS644]
MSDAYHNSEADRRDQDGGRAKRAWRWFSARTIRSAERYRDMGWAMVVRRAAMAVALIAISRIDRGFALSPWLLIGGGIWLLVLMRIIALKAFDAGAAPRR